jgi:hypothetical protein
VADITDFFFFRSYEAGKDDKAILIMDVNSEEPSSGPNYFNFGDDVRYSFEVDNDRDGIADDIRFDVEFDTEFAGINAAAKLPLAYVALDQNAAISQITSLDHPGVGPRQRYSVTMWRNGVKTVLGTGLRAVPSNVGPLTMPNYMTLAQMGTYTLPGGIKVLAGQRQDPFYIDLGATFDSLNLRRNLPLLTPAEDANDGVNPFGVDMLSGFNTHSIVLEVPVSLLTKDAKGPDATSHPALGAYASTSRRALTVRTPFGQKSTGPWIQVQRLANPLINEAVIGTVDKDRWNGLAPHQESQFLDYYLNPRLALALQIVYGVPAATANRADLVDILLKYPGQSPSAKLSDLLRLDVSVAPAPLASQKRLTVLAGDNAGWPNGRRPKDDVTDVAVRVVGGANYVNGRAGDGVNVDDAPLTGAFPFLADPADGRGRFHQNP